MQKRKGRRKRGEGIFLLVMSSSEIVRGSGGGEGTEEGVRQ